MGWGFHPLGAWAANSRECLAMLLRPGSAGSNTFTDHKEVLAAALQQVPSAFRRRVPVRIDGAGASHKLIEHMLALSSARKTLLFTSGRTILDADGEAIAALPASAWEPGLRQDGSTEDDKDVAEITCLMSRAGIWPEGLRFIARRVKPSRRHKKNMTAFEKRTGWKYSITCTNIPLAGIAGVPGSHHPQYIDAVQRDHATVETGGVRTAKAMGCGTCRRRPGGSTQDGSSRRTSPPVSPPGPGFSACMTSLTCGTPSRTRSATGSGTCPPGSSATPARRSSRSARTGPGTMPSSSAGTGSAPCPRPADQHQLPRRHRRRRIPAEWKPVPPRAYRAASRATRQTQNGHEAQKPAQARTVTRYGSPDSLRLTPGMAPRTHSISSN
jgi:hypothetical protein